MSELDRAVQRLASLSAPNICNCPKCGASHHPLNAGPPPETRDLIARAERWMVRFHFDPKSARRANPDDELGWLIYDLGKMLADKS